MIIEKLSIYNFHTRKLIKDYTFNTVGLNVILGDKRNENEDTNGVGKSTFIRQLHFLLGKDFSKEKIPDVLIQNNILVSLKIVVDGKSVYLARLFTDQEHGYILDGESFNIDLSIWEKYKTNRYRLHIDKLMNFNMNNISFAALREYIMRDEKEGFNSIIIKGRNALQQHKVLNSLFNLPNNYETDIDKMTKQIKKMEDDKKFIESYKHSAEKLEIEKQNIEKEIAILEKQILELNIGDFSTKQADVYSVLKEQQSKIQSSIYKIKHSIKQYQKNIEHINRKSVELEKLNGLKEFYNQINVVLPENIEKNFEDIQTFYNLMRQDRGNFFITKIEEAEFELSILEKQNNTLTDKINECTRTLKETNFINDISHIQRKLNLLQSQLAQIEIRIADYERINEINIEIQEKKLERSKEIVKLNNNFKSYNEQIIRLNQLFNQIILDTYNVQTGYLTFSFNNNDKMNAKSGRITIDSFIPEEESFGRYNSKIRAIDLTWLMYRIEKGLPINFLVHDGSFSVTDNYATFKMLKTAHEFLCGHGRGQYIVTLNRKDVDAEALAYFKKNKLVIADLKKDQDENRFFGFKY
ncbi:TPA: DUF2326 domain-containing protein [Bacillus wiedmannii]